MESINYLLSVGWKPQEWNTDDDGKRTSPKLSHKDEFNGVQGREGNLFARRMQIKHRRSNIAGYFKKVRTDGRMSSRVTGLAETGRAKHADIVNVPNSEAFFGKWMRKIFTSPEDKVLIGTDSAGCQNRMLAARVGDPTFTNTLIHGKKEDKTSIHYINQEAVRQAGYDVKYGMMKNLNYAFMFGASDNKLGTMIGRGKADGTRIREAFLGVSTGFEGLLRDITTEWRMHAKTRRDPWGRKEWYNGRIAGLDGRPIFIDSEHKLLVYLLQSDEAIMMSAAYVFLYDWLTDEGFVWGDDWAYVNWNHDEYTLEVKPEHVDRISYLSEQAITKAGEYFRINCPHEGESAVGNNWYDIH
jgi:DNA polymerase I-like protein with 3'-5' exonuclease and polymerase domains